MDNIHARNACPPVASAYEGTTLDFEIWFALSTTFLRLNTANTNFSLTRTKNGTPWILKVYASALLEPCIKADVRKKNVVEFVNENENVLSAYAADDSGGTSALAHMASPRGDQQNLGESLPFDQTACSPLSPTHEISSNIDQTESMTIEEPVKNAVLLDPSLAASLDEADVSQQRASTQLERNRRELSPELKFQTFQKSPSFDTFRPRPRSHFSSDAMSVWPLRSIEESRLLQHFVQNLAAWVRL